MKLQQPGYLIIKNNMRNKLFSLAMIGAFALSTLTCAAASNAGPYYVMVRWGDFDPSMKYENSTDWIGDITLDKGKMSVAQDILVDPKEILTNSVNDVGNEASNIHFETHTNSDYDGVILKLNVSDEEMKNNFLRIKFGHKAGEMTHDNSFSLDDLSKWNENYEADDSNGGGYFWVKNIFVNNEASLAKRNLMMKNKLTAINGMLNLERFLRNNAVDATIFQKIRNQFDTNLDKNVSDFKLAQFNRKMQILSYKFKNHKISQEQFLSGSLAAMRLL